MKSSLLMLDTALILARWRVVIESGWPMSHFTMYIGWHGHGHATWWQESWTTWTCHMVTDYTSSSTTVYSNIWNIVIIPYSCEYNPIKYLLGSVHACWHLLVLYPSDLTHTLSGAAGLMQAQGAPLCARQARRCPFEITTTTSLPAHWRQPATGGGEAKDNRVISAP